MKTKISILFAVLISSAAVSLPISAKGVTREEMKEQRKQLAHRQRRLIHNSDGHDITPLVGTHVDSIFNKKGKLFYSHTPPTEGIDQMQAAVDFCRQHNIEIFNSSRMNDIHDVDGRELSQFKKDHPEYLFGTRENGPPYGTWTGVDYGRPEVCEHAFGELKDKFERYDMDGIELDFFRHPVFFKRHAWGEPLPQTDLDNMTELLRRVRRMTEDLSLRRGRPLLISVRVPDSVGFCRAIGLDLERWLAEDLIDILVVGGYFRLQPWEESVALGHRYGVPVYAELSESRVGARAWKTRGSTESYRARAMNAWNAGVDGVYVFNVWRTGKDRSPFLGEIGEPTSLQKLDKVYYASVLAAADAYSKPQWWVADGGRFQSAELSTLSPDRPVTLKASEPLVIPLRVGENVLWGKAEGIVPEVKLDLQGAGCHSWANFSVTFNGVPLGAPSAMIRRSEDWVEPDWLEYMVSPELVRQGTNAVTIRSDSEVAPVLSDLKLVVSYPIPKTQ